MNPIKISIIIPVYNAALHLEQCIGSVLAQTLHDIEVIIINDGSTDDSISIIKKFQKQDGRVVVINSANEGVSAARNKGLAIAIGEYIGFVDADDWIEPEMYETLYQNITLSIADLAICNVNQASENKTIKTRLSLEDNIVDITTDREKELVNLMRFKYDFANWNKIYSAEIIKKNNLHFEEKMSVYEDLFFNLCYFQFSKKAVVVNESLYNYRLHNDSVMSVGKHDPIKENNLLYDGFNSFCQTHGCTVGIESCNAEMRRGFFYAVIPKLIKQIISQNAYFLKKVNLISGYLRNAVPGLYDYNNSELKGLVGIKKRLLKNRGFYLFALLSVLRAKS